MPDSELPATFDAGDSPTLRRGTMSVAAATAFALTALQVGPNFAQSAAYMQSTAGNGSWISLLCALLLSLTIAGALTLYARRCVVSGSLVSYAHIAFGRPGSILVGSCLFLAYSAALSATSTTAVLFGIGTLVDVGVNFGDELAAQLVAVVAITGLAASLAYRGIDTSVRVSVTLGFICIPVVICVLVAALLRHGIHAGGQFDFAHIPWGSVVSGIIVSFGFYVGFDGVTSLAEETKDPLKNVSIILLTSLTLFGLLIVGGCLLEAPLVREHALDLDNGVSPLAILARQGAWPMLGTLGDACITLASTAATIAFLNYGARVSATAAVDGLLPLWMAAIHPHFRSPHRAVIVQGSLGALLPVTLSAVFRTTPLQLTIYNSNMMVFMWLVPYIIVCAGTVVIGYREKSLLRGPVLAGGIGAASCVGVLADSLNLPHSDPNWRLAILSYCLVGISAIVCTLVMISRGVTRVATTSPDRSSRK
jgi:amino acid transporter